MWNNNFKRTLFTFSEDTQKSFFFTKVHFYVICNICSWKNILSIKFLILTKKCDGGVGSEQKKKNISEKKRSFWKLKEKKKHFKKLILEISETWILCLLKTCVYWRNLVVVIQTGLVRKKFFFQSKEQKMKNKLIILLSEEQFLFENDLLRMHKLYRCFFFLIQNLRVVIWKTEIMVKKCFFLI